MLKVNGTRQNTRILIFPYSMFQFSALRMNRKLMGFFFNFFKTRLVFTDVSRFRQIQLCYDAFRPRHFQFSIHFPQSPALTQSLHK